MFARCSMVSLLGSQSTISLLTVWPDWSVAVDVQVLGFAEIGHLSRCGRVEAMKEKPCGILPYMCRARGSVEVRPGHRLYGESAHILDELHGKPCGENSLESLERNGASTGSVQCKGDTGSLRPPRDSKYWTLIVETDEVSMLDHVIGIPEMLLQVHLHIFLTDVNATSDHKGVLAVNLVHHRCKDSIYD